MSLVTTHSRTIVELESFNFFALELPDPDACLFGQVLGQFTLFPKLPIEIRLAIWRTAFPSGRDVDLSSSSACNRTVEVFAMMFSTNIQWKQPNELRNHLKAHFPVTFMVNRESRLETEKYYIIVLPQRSPCYWLKPVPIWLNPNIDSLSITGHWLRDAFEQLKELFSDIARKKTNIRILDRIRTLEILTITFDEDLSYSEEFEQTNPFLHVPSLFSITFRPNNECRPLLEKQMNNFKDQMRTWFPDSKQCNTMTRSTSRIDLEAKYPDSSQITLFLWDSE